MLSDNELLWEQVERFRKLLSEHKKDLHAMNQELSEAKSTIKERDTEIKVLRKERESMQDKHLN